ncbi:hypothetical protein CWC20_11880 [Pseudoalteromonas aurantia]|uniref:Uncharacterized protein n=1 Tax=Pseudoalteromonas aurantia TaxID=43654 RepID=A0A5S3V833_9GAMM|nr:hypothetical protein CWC19_11790 [Pseudoalteromonas aurantia]TMO73924.1 hypothetical protein CWC20_11880 [Pseudoalteromonas aurantia]
MVAITLLMYLVGFSLAYTVLDAGFGALILFTSVTLTMVVRGLLLGQRLSDVQWGISCGFVKFECSIKPRFIRHKLACCRGYDDQWVRVGAYSLHGAKLRERPRSNAKYRR